MQFGKLFVFSEGPRKFVNMRKKGMHFVLIPHFGIS